MDVRASASGDVLTGADGVPVSLRTRLWGLLVRGGHALWWYATNLMGDTAYGTYVKHHNAHHPDEPPVTEREFWRQHYAAQDANPGSRCC